MNIFDLGLLRSLVDLAKGYNLKHKRAGYRATFGADIILWRATSSPLVKVNY